MQTQSSPKTIDQLFVAAITPYFLEKGNVWFEENLQKILIARKTQAFFQDNTLFLEKDQQYSVSELLRKLDELGYEKVLTVEQMGEFSHRGGTVEVFPVNSLSAWRIEFVGNRVELVEQLPVGVKDETNVKEVLKRRLKSQKLFSDLKSITPGDYLVHLDHGVGIFDGFTQIQDTKYYILSYAAEDKL